MAGGLFAISANYFASLGWYDPGYEVWGAENLELSFKVSVCSRIFAQKLSVAELYENLSFAKR